MKKILRIFVFSLLLFANANAQERNNKLDKLFIQLKDTKQLTSAQEIEKKYKKFG